VAENKENKGARVGAREMKIALLHPGAGSGSVDLIGNPIKLSKTPVQYRRAPPMCGADSRDVLDELEGLNPQSPPGPTGPSGLRRPDRR